MDLYDALDTNINETLTNSTDNRSTYEQISQTLWMVISPVLFLIGLVGNTIAFMVLFKLFRKLKSTFHLFLLILSLNDLIVLCSGLSRYWILNVFHIDVRNLNNAICKLQLHVIYTTMQFSAWILVSVTVHRFLIVAKHISKLSYNPKIAGIQLGIIFFILTSLNFHYFFTNGIINGSCNSLTKEIFEFEEYAFVWVDLFILCIIPFIIMLLGNIYFLSNFEKCSAKVTKFDGVINKRIKHSIRIIMRLTWLFLMTNLPVSIFLIVDSYYEESDVKELLRSICFLIQYAGFSFNICLYVSVDPNFLSVLRPKGKFCRKIHCFKWR